jgi:hypothetical protein
MGLFLSIPKDVFKNHILRYLPDYLHRLRLARTCKSFLKEMKEKDEMTSCIIKKFYHESLLLAAKMDHYPSFTRLLLLISTKQLLQSKYYCKFFETKNEMIIMDMRRSIPPDNIIYFDKNALIYLYGLYGENIPESFFEILCSDIGRCSAFAYLGSTKLYQRFSERSLIRDTMLSFESFNCFWNMVCFNAGVGGHIEICRIIFQRIIMTKSYKELMMNELIEHNHKETISALSQEFPDFIVKNKKQKI